MATGHLYETIGQNRTTLMHIHSCAFERQPGPNSMAASQSLYKKLVKCFIDLNVGTLINARALTWITSG